MSLRHFLAVGNNNSTSLRSELVDDITTQETGSTEDSCGIASKRRPSTLDLQDRLSGSSDRDILEKSALRLKLNPRSGDECLRPQGGIDELVDREIVRRRRHLNLPKAALKPLAYYLNKYLWWPTISADEVEREFIDQRIDPTAKTFKDLGIEPAELEGLTFHYLKGYRSASYYDLPPATERERQEEKKYVHVLDDQ